MRYPVQSIGRFHRSQFTFILVVAFLAPLAASAFEAQHTASKRPVLLHVDHDESTGTISVFRSGTDQRIVTQNAGAAHRPFLHPIVAPDGRGLLTEYSPGHHKHQTGLYWGFISKTSINQTALLSETQLLDLILGKIK